MTRLLSLFAAVFCLGCAPAQQPPAVPVDPAPVEAVRPAGPHAVGVTAGPTVANGVTTRLYYPAASGGEPDAAAMTPDHRNGLGRRFGPGVAEALDRAVTAARRDAPPVAGRFPLAIFQPGAALAAVDYRLLIEDLASRGYVVLALNADGSPGASGERYPAAAAELLAALATARAGGHPALAQADTDRVAFVGHSLGGAAAVIALSRARGVVAINLDGDLNAAPTVPAGASLLYILGQTQGEGDGSRARRAGVWRDLSAGVADAVPLQVVSLKHFDFADAALLQASVPPDRRAARLGAIGGAQAHALTADLISAFLDSRLKGDAAAWPAALARHPEATAPTTW